MINPNDKVKIVKTPYGSGELPLDFDVKYKTIRVNIKELDGSSIATAVLDNGELVDFRDGPFKPNGAPFITLLVGHIADNGGLDLEKIIHDNILPGFGIPEIPLDHLGE